MSRDSDHLLYVVSAKTEMSWTEFKRVFDHLYILKEQSNGMELASLPFIRGESVRAIGALAHCEFDFDKSVRMVSVASPILARLPIPGPPQAILIGARSPRTVDEIYEACRIVSPSISIALKDQPSGLALVPSRVVIQAHSTEQVSNVADLLGIRYADTPSAWTILHFAGSLDEYLTTRQWSLGNELNWSRKEFNFNSLQFEYAGQEVSTVRLSSYLDRIRNTQICLLWKDGRYAQLDRDWGRYAALEAAGLNIMIYDQQRLLLATPASVPLPRLLARSLALCSGYAPQFIPRQKLAYFSPETVGFDLFSDVPPQIAEMVAGKLGQSLLLYALDLTS